MSPIRPEMLDLYGPDWRPISDWIRFDRALGRCECTGECGGRLHRMWYLPQTLTAHNPPSRCPNYHGGRSRFTGSRVVLTTAHLEHDPSDNRPEILMAMCQACHLAYDAEHHAATRAERRGH